MVNKFDNNVFIYWIGYDYKLIKFLRGLIYHHSNKNKNYKVHLIDSNNLLDYLDKVPNYFFNLQPSHQADFIRVNVLYKYGGLWLDSDTIVMNDLSSLFDVIKKQNGFFIQQSDDKFNKKLCNGILGTIPGTELFYKWSELLTKILNKKQNKISWEEIGNDILKKFMENEPYLYKDYKFYDGVDNMYPVSWKIHSQEYLKKPYENWMNLVRDFQPLIILTNSVYKESENLTEFEILNKTPLSYFIKKSLTSQYE